MPRPYVSDTIPIVEYENESKPSYYHYITTTKESSHQCEAAVEQLSDYQSLVQFSLLLLYAPTLSFLTFLEICRV